MEFTPEFRILPRMLRQLKAIERTAGFLEAVRLRPDWIAEVQQEIQVTEALASVQIEGNSLTLKEAFALAEELPDRKLRDSEKASIGIMCFGISNRQSIGQLPLMLMS